MMYVAREKYRGGGILLSGRKSDLIYSLLERSHTSTRNIHLWKGRKKSIYTKCRPTPRTFEKVLMDPIRPNVSKNVVKKCQQNNF